MAERILLKLILIHLCLLAIVQGYLHSTPFLKSMNKIYLYEGVAGRSDMDEDKIDVYLNQ